MPDPDHKPKPDIRPPDEEPNPKRKEPEPDEQPGRPMPDGVPTEIRASGAHVYLGEGIYEYKPVRLRSGWCNRLD